MFIKTNNSIRYTPSDVEAFEFLPVGNWLVKFDMKNMEYYLEKTPDFTVPKKIYGNSEALAERYLSSFDLADKNLGVLLTGLKGTGKSLTAKLTCIKSELPVIIVTEDFKGEEFKSFLNDISQKVVVFIDEFEKVYPDVKKQNSFLSILDGVFEGHKLFIFTSNNKENINPYMLNRLGRVRYLNEYSSLDESIITEVISDLLVNKDYEKEMLEIIDILGTVSMDMIVFLIQECNIYKQSPRESMKYLNLRPDDSTYKVEIFEKGEKTGSTSVRRHPLKLETLTIEYYNLKREWDDIELQLDECKIVRDGKELIISKGDLKLVCKPNEVYRYVF